ncbi:hypothetical protein L596_023187 [Steinernema carpocapsae]|uniref:Uncharacterized protein n=1 Tax=Steinernema carpocapsae TaxID=34508 RepID=A0A4U5MCW1_STECR|nr:hypothetical protein L596_023187 [Steinernema carpocapsae]
MRCGKVAFCLLIGWVSTCGLAILFLGVLTTLFDPKKFPVVVIMTMCSMISIYLLLRVIYSKNSEQDPEAPVPYYIDQVEPVYYDLIGPQFIDDLETHDL